MRKLIIAAALSATIAGCGAYYGYDSYGYGYASPSYGVAVSPYGASIYTSVAPPPPLVEVAPPAPGPGYAWIDGYWGWNGRQYAWNRGYWGAPPAPGYAWQPYGWVYDGGRYRFVPGRWYRRGRSVRVPYVYAPPPVRHGARYGTIPYRGRVYATPGRPPSYVYRVR
jgi:hypothetical protein